MGKSLFEHKSTLRDMENFQRRIERFSQQDIEEKNKFFQKNNYGIIVQSYPFEYERLIYEKIANLISRKYPEVVDEADIINTLTSAGSIYTMKVSSTHGHGFYHMNSADIGVYSYLDRISEELLHEIIHKLGFLKFNPEFYDMDTIYREAGTELVTHKVLGTSECKECIVRGIWTKAYGSEQEYLLQTVLVNQINQIIGGESLEKSVLQGTNDFQKTMNSVFGEAYSRTLNKRIKEILGFEKEYWNNYIKNGNDDVRERKIIKLIKVFQDDLLHTRFDSIFDLISDKSEAESVLNKLVEFSNYRVKTKTVEDGEILFRDEEFKEYFSGYKERLEKKFKTKFDVQYDEFQWEKEHPILYLPDSIKVKREKEKSTINKAARYSKGNKNFISILPRKGKRREVKIEEMPTEGWIQKVELSYNTILDSKEGLLDSKKVNDEVEFEEP